MGADTFHEEIEAFLDLSKICWSPNYCKFRNKFLEFPEGVSRYSSGTQLGFLISEAFMPKFEKDLFSSDHVLLSHVIIAIDPLTTFRAN